MPLFKHLQTAGAALARWLAITREQPTVLPDSAVREIREAAQRHLLYSARALVGFVPKHHFFAELSKSTDLHGNPQGVRNVARRVPQFEIEECGCGCAHGTPGAAHFRSAEFSSIVGPAPKCVWRCSSVRRDRGVRNICNKHTVMTTCNRRGRSHPTYRQ